MITATFNDDGTIDNFDEETGAHIHTYYYDEDWDVAAIDVDDTTVTLLDSEGESVFDYDIWECVSQIEYDQIVREHCEDQI